MHSIYVLAYLLVPLLALIAGVPHSALASPSPSPAAFGVHRWGNAGVGAGAGAARGAGPGAGAAGSATRRAGNADVNVNANANTNANPNPHGGGASVRRKASSSSSPNKPLLSEGSSVQQYAYDDEDFEVDVLPFVLVSSIDGALHAIDRDTGEVRWTLRDGVEPLVGGRVDGKWDEEYIVEPLSGNIYVLEVENSVDLGVPTVRKLPMTVDELIHKSPFAFPYSPNRQFTGLRETSLLTIDLRTGKKLDCFNSRNPLASTPSVCVNDLLDDIEGSGRKNHDTLFVGRTDYRLTIQTPGLEPLRPGQAPKINTQQLRYSTYTPNSYDRALAEYWERTGGRSGQDLQNNQKRTRVELGRDGYILGIHEEEGKKWQSSIDSVGVAVYDVVLSSSSLSAYPVIVPQPMIDIPSLANRPPTTYIGAVPQQKSLSPSPIDAGSQPAGADDTPPASQMPNEDANPRPLLFAQSSHSYPILSVDNRPPLPGSSINGSFLLTEEMPETHKAEMRFPRIDPPKDTNSGEPLPGEEYEVVEPNDGQRKGWAWFFVAVLGLLSLFGVHVARAGKAKTVNNGVIDLSDATTPVMRSSLGEKSTARSTAVSPSVRFDAVITENGTPVPLDQDAAGTPPKKRNQRRRVRGKKKRRNSVGPRDEGNEGTDEEDRGNLSSTPSDAGDKSSVAVTLLSGEKPLPEIPQSEAAPATQPEDDHVPERLSISDSVIGYGSHGTVVLKGTWGGRPVAVKRLLSDFVRLASQEVKLLQASDDHPNVIRYYCQERRDNFLYIALDLCQASLADLIETPNNSDFTLLSNKLDRKVALQQITSGLKHLHAMKIIHRDIKPQNVLVSEGKDGKLRMLVSDFGLARRLEQGQSSFAPTGNNLAGSLGWRAPECIRGQVKLNEGFDPVLSCSSSGSATSSYGSFSDLTALADGEGTPKMPSRRLTKAVDLFALGCLYFWVLMGGEHPFGETYNRESNIVKADAVNMDHLSVLGEEGVEAQALISSLLSAEPGERPDTGECLIHPFFWAPAKRLAFLCDASDRFEIMETDPPESTLVALETNAQAVVGKDWYSRMDRVFTSNLGKYRKYKGNTVRDLLRAMRNKKHHYQDLEPSAQRHLGSLPAGFLQYFTSRFPRLFLHVHAVVRDSRLRTESMFEVYFQE